ncbi:MAG: metal ABC transporter substrate-binding protein [Acidimicrobiales bacterium]
MVRRRWSVMAASLLAVLLPACGGSGGAGGRLRVVAGFYPLAEAAARIGGDLVSVTNLTPAGSEPHDLELRTADVDRIEDAAVVLYLGGGFQPALERAARRAKGAAVELLGEDFHLLQAHDGGGGGAKAGDHGAEVADPHIWLDPVLMGRVAERTVAALVQADPAHRSTFEANGRAYGAELESLHAAFQQGLAHCDRRVIVTSHAAFGYLARRYDLTQEAIAGLEPENEPDPRRLARLTTQVRSQGITTIFYETLVSPRVAATLAKEAGVKTAVLNPIEGLSDEELGRGQTYAGVMRENLAALRAALGCR